MGRVAVRCRVNSMGGAPPVGNTLEGAVTSERRHIKLPAHCCNNPRNGLAQLFNVDTFGPPLLYNQTVTKTLPPAPKVHPRWFACTCDTPGKNPKIDQVAALHAWAHAYFSDVNRLSVPSTLLTDVVYTLDGSYSASITGIRSDMWAVISTATYDTFKKGKHKGEPRFTTYIQCDRVEDGLVATLKAYYDKFGDQR